MPARREEYILPLGGQISTDRKRYAIIATVDEVIGAALLYSKRILPQYFVATAEHESGRALNEVDTEPDGFVSKGIFQISDDEAKAVGLANADLLDLQQAMRVFARLMEQRLDAIQKAAGTGYKLPDAWAYLTVAHNQGTGAAMATIKNYGMDWAAYKSRNQGQAQAGVAAAQSNVDVAKTHGDTSGIIVAKGNLAKAQDKLAWWGKVFTYGDDAISGGPSWKCPC